MGPCWGYRWNDNNNNNNNNMAYTCRSTDPRPKQWVLLSKTAEIVDLMERAGDKAGDEEAEKTNTARLSVTVDASKYS